MPDRLDPAPLVRELDDPRGADDLSADRSQRLRVEVVSVPVRGEDGVHERQPLGIDHASRHPDVRRVRLLVLASE